MPRKAEAVKSRGRGDTDLGGNHQDVILSLYSELERHAGSPDHAVLVDVAELIVFIILW